MSALSWLEDCGCRFAAAYSQRYGIDVEPTAVSNQQLVEFGFYLWIHRFPDCLWWLFLSRGAVVKVFKKPAAKPPTTL